MNTPAVDGTSQAGRLAGVLVQDASQRYTFQPSNIPAFGAENALLTFHMDPSGISIPTLPGEPGYPALTTFDWSSNPAVPTAGRGGFQVVVLGAMVTNVLEVPSRTSPSYRVRGSTTTTARRSG